MLRRIHLKANFYVFFIFGPIFEFVGVRHTHGHTDFTLLAAVYFDSKDCAQTRSYQPHNFQSPRIYAKHRMKAL